MYCNKLLGLQAKAISDLEGDSKRILQQQQKKVLKGGCGGACLSNHISRVNKKYFNDL